MNKPKATKNSAPRDGDARLRRGGAPEVRGERGTPSAERTTDAGLLSSDELEQLIRDEFDSTPLPSPPALPGFHLCWLTTTSGYDTLQKRMRIGYVPVERAEMQVFDPSNGQALTNYEKYITCNEMILCKIPERVYQGIMSYFHHKKPMEEERAIMEQMRKVTEHSSQAGRKQNELLAEEADGTQELEQSVKHAERVQPTFG